MNKPTSLLIAAIPMFIGNFVATPADASPDIVNNSHPNICGLVKNGKVQGHCKTFKLSKIVDAITKETVFLAKFTFDDFSVTYKASDRDEVGSETYEKNGKTFTVYPVFTETLEQRGLKPKTSEVSEGICQIQSNYNEVLCEISGSDYFYRGKPTSAQSNTASPKKRAEGTKPTEPNSAGNSKKYAFDTNSHIDTGISVKPGDKIKIKAIGTIRFGIFAGSGGPEGIFFNPNYNYFVDIPHGQLIGRIRKFGMGDLDGWIAIGAGREVVAREPGILELAVNDNQPEDNIGEFRIEVTVNSAK